MASFQEFFRPPVFANDEDKTLKARQLTIILWVIAGILTAINIAYLLPDFSFGPFNVISTITILFILGLVWLTRRGHIMAASHLLTTGLFAFLVFQAWSSEGIRDVTFIALFGVVIVAALLTGWRPALFFAVASIIAGWVLTYAEMAGIINPEVGQVNTYARDISAIYVVVIVLLYLTINNLESALNKARTSNVELKNLSEDLERRVSERTRDLALAAEVSRSVSRIRDLSKLLNQSVDLIRARFQLYYAQIYLVDESGKNLILRAGTGDAGRLLLNRGHKLPINERSINGKAAATKEAIIVKDTTRDPLFRPNPFLTQTRSEVAIPLLIGERIVGVVNMQSEQPRTFTEVNLPALIALAGQLAVAIDNASLFAERQRVEEEAMKFKLGIDRSTSAVFLTNVDGTIQYVNPGFENLYGWQAEEAIGQNPRILKSGVIPQEQYAHFWHTLLSKGVVAGEIINKRKDGRLLNIQGSNNPIVNSEGDLIGFLSVHTDITQRKEAEIQLERSVSELNCLNDIGRKAEEQPSIPEFLQWVCQRIPEAMPFAEQCMAAVSLGDSVYGQAKAMSLPRHMVEGLRIGGELIGRLYIAYEDAELSFVDEDSSFIGGIGRRISSFIESQRLLLQVQKRAAEMQTVAQVGTAVAGNLDTSQLLQDVVDMTKERFGLYHAHIYLLNEARDTLVLAAGAGEAGRKMVAQGRRIPLNQVRSLVARAARQQQGVIANDVQAEPDFLPNSLLPNTRAELAVPLIAGDVVLGVLDVQSDEINNFTEEDINTQTTLATQVATALQNAQQFEQTQLALEELRVLQQTFVRDGWQAFLESEEREVQGFVAAGKDIKPIVRNGHAPQGSVTTLTELSAEKTADINPVSLSGTNIGGLGVRLPKNGQLTDQQRALLDALTEEVSQALERARLAEQTQIALSEAETLSQLGAQLNAAQSYSTMSTAVAQIMQSRTNESLRVTLFQVETDRQGQPNNLILVASSSTDIITQKQQIPVRLLNEHPAWTDGELILIENVATDGRLNEQERASYQERGVRSLALLPLRLGTDWAGLFTLAWTEAVTFSAADKRLLTAMIDQIALAMNSLQLLSTAQQRARQEQILREVSTRVNAAADPESILRTAAQEVGRALGLETFVYLTENANHNKSAGN